jgi:hypothetical protein
MFCLPLLFVGVCALITSRHKPPFVRSTSIV